MSSDFLMLFFQDPKYMQNKKGNLKIPYDNVPPLILPKKERKIKQKRPPEIQTENRRK